MGMKTPSKTPKKMGRPPKEKVPETVAKSLIVAQATGDPVKLSKAIGKAAQTPAPANMNITDEMMVLILDRVSSGELLRTVCKDFKVSAALVRKRARDHAHWGEELTEARIQMAEELYDRMLEVAQDTTIDVPRARLIVDVLKDHAKVNNRGKFGDKVTVDHKQLVVNVTKDDLDLL